MNVDLTIWKIGLLFAAFSVLLGMSGLITASNRDERRITGGMILQGILIAFVVGGRYFQGTAAISVGGIAIVGLLVIQTIRSGLNSPSSSDEPANEIP